MVGRTTIVIAHRLSTIRKADMIVVLDGNGIAERGTHDQLVAKGGLYRRLLDVQRQLEPAAVEAIARVESDQDSPGGVRPGLLRVAASST